MYQCHQEARVWRRERDFVPSSRRPPPQPPKLVTDENGPQVFGQAEIEEQRAILEEIERQRGAIRIDAPDTREASPECCRNGAVITGYSTNEIEEQRSILEEIERQRRQRVDQTSRVEKPEWVSAPVRRSRAFEKTGGKCFQHKEKAPASQIPSGLHDRHAEERHRSIKKPVDRQKQPKDDDDNCRRSRIGSVDTPSLDGLSLGCQSHGALSRAKWLKKKHGQQSIKIEGSEPRGTISRDTLTESRHESFRLANGQHVRVFDSSTTSGSPLGGQKRAATCIGCERSFAVSRECKVLYCRNCGTLTPLEIRKEAGAWEHH